MRKSLSVALLAFSIALICANVLAKRVHRFLHPQAEEEKLEAVFFPFALPGERNYIIVHEEEKDEYSLEEQNTNAVIEEDFQPEKQIVQPVLKIELTEEEKEIVIDYTKNDKMRAFITELSGIISQEDLNQENYLKIAYNPQVRDIFMKYAQDEEFRKMAANVMKDKEILEFTKKIIQNNEVKK